MCRRRVPSKNCFFENGRTEKCSQSRSEHFCLIQFSAMCKSKSEPAAYHLSRSKSNSRWYVPLHENKVLYQRIVIKNEGVIKMYWNLKLSSLIEIFRFLLLADFGEDFGTWHSAKGLPANPWRRMRSFKIECVKIYLYDSSENRYLSFFQNRIFIIFYNLNLFRISKCIQTIQNYQHQKYKFLER